MGEGRTSSAGRELADELRESIQDSEPRTPAETQLSDAGWTRLDDLGERQALRMLEVREDPRPSWGSF